MKEMTEKLINLKEETRIEKSERENVEQKLVNLAKLKEVEIKEYEQKIIMFNNLLTKERTVSTTYNQFLADEKAALKHEKTKNIELTKEKSKLSINHNKLEIEYEHIKNQFEELKKEYDILKAESNKSTYQTKHSISLADDYRTKLESIKYKYSKQIEKINKEHTLKLTKLNNQIEN